MKRISSLFFSIGFAFLAGGFAPRLLASGFPQDESDLRPDPDAHFGELANGVHYIVLTNRQPEDRASFRLIVGAGSFNEADDQQGLAHFIAHLAFKGSAHYPPGTLAPILQRWGMSGDPEDNSQTDFQHTDYLLELPDTRATTLKEGCRIFADYAGGLLLREDQIDAERTIILTEKLQRNNAAYRTQIAELKFTLGDTLIPKRLPIGLGDDLEQAKSARFVDFYNSWYRPEKMTVIAVGDFDADTVEALIKDAFEGLTDRAPAQPDPKLGDLPFLSGLKAGFHLEDEAPGAAISIQTITPYYHEADTADGRLANLRRGVAFALLNRRLAAAAQRDNAPFARSAADVGEQFDFVHNASIHLVCPSDRWQEALAAGEQELRRALQYGFQAPEVRSVVSVMRQGLEQAAKEAGKRTSAKLADALVRSVVQDKVFTSPAESLAIYGPALDRVTAADCQRALQEAWAAKGRYLFVSGNVPLPNPEQTISAAYRASESVAVAPLPEIKEMTFPYVYFGTPGQVVSRREIADLGITEVTFANGVRLNLKKTDFEPQTIDVSVRFGGGKLIEPADAEPGLAQLTQSVFIGGGLGKLTIKDLEHTFAGKPVGVDFGIMDDAFTFFGSTDEPNLSLELQLIAAYFTDPAYRPEALATIRQSLPSVYGNLMHSANGVIQTEITRFLVNGDPRFGVAEGKDLMARNIDEIKAWLSPQLEHGAMEVAIVGDFDTAAAIDAVARTLGALPAREAKPAYVAERTISMPKQPESRSYSVPMDRDIGTVYIVWPTTDGRDPALAHRLGLLASIFTQRLAAKISSQDVLPPGAVARSNPSTTYPGYGTFSVSATVNPAKLELIGRTVLDVAADFQKNGVTAAELDHAKQLALVEVKESLNHNDYWLGSVLAEAQEEPQRLDWARQRSDDFASITIEEIDRLAVHYLDLARASRFAIAPAKAAQETPASP